MTTAPITTPKPRRRWLRFSLRTMLAVVARESVCQQSANGHCPMAVTIHEFHSQGERAIAGDWHRQLPMVMVVVLGYWLVAGTGQWCDNCVVSVAAELGERSAKEASSPLDTLERSQIPEYELRWAGEGDAKAVPPELVAILGTSRLRPWGSFDAMTFSSDSKMLASIGHSDGIRMWNADTGEQCRCLPAVTSGCEGLALASDNKMVAFNAGGSIRLWDLPAGRPLPASERDIGRIEFLQFSPDGRFLASFGYDFTIRIWRTSDYAQQCEIPRKTRIRNESLVAFSPNSKSVATATESGVELWSLASGTLLRTFDKRPSFGVAFGNDGLQLAAALRGQIQTWDVVSGMPKSSFPAGTPQPLDAVSFRGGVLAIGDTRGTVTIWSATTGPNGRVLHRTHDSWYRRMRVVVSPDGKRLAARVGHDWVIRLWDLTSGKEISPRNSPQYEDVAVSPDGTLVALATARLGDRRVDIWEPLTRSGRYSIPVIEDWSFVAAPFSHDSRLLLLLGRYGSASVWDCSLGRPRWALADDPASYSPRAGALSRDGRSLVMARGGMLKRFDLSTGKCQSLQEDSYYEYHAFWLTSVTYSPDGRWFSSADEKGTVLLWDARSGTVSRVLEEHTFRDNSFSCYASVLGFTDDSTQLVGVRGSHVKRWDVATGKPLHQFPKPASSLTFCPATNVLASRSGTRALTLWSAQTGEPTKTVSAAPQRHWFRAQALSSDGRYLFTVNGNGTVYVFRLTGAK